MKNLDKIFKKAKTDKAIPVPILLLGVYNMFVSFPDPGCFYQYKYFIDEELRYR